MGSRRPYNRPLDIVGHAGMTDIIICLRDILLSLYATNYYLCTRHIIIYVRDILLSMYETYYYLETYWYLCICYMHIYVSFHFSPSIFVTPPFPAYFSRHRFPPISHATVSRQRFPPPFPATISRQLLYSPPISPATVSRQLVSSPPIKPTSHPAGEALNGQQSKLYNIPTKD